MLKPYKRTWPKNSCDTSLEEKFVILRRDYSTTNDKNIAEVIKIEDILKQRNWFRAVHLA